MTMVTTEQFQMKKFHFEGVLHVTAKNAFDGVKMGEAISFIA
ncbi:MAG: hypothetical protein NTZ69_08160 [Bacteroidia bacterium]|nr:hypothetical protein [Bacteroidia bacterium]